MKAAIILVIVLATAWTWVTGKWYAALRWAIVGSSPSSARKAVLVVVGAAVVAPGLVSLGHPPPLPCPFAGFLAIAQLVGYRGQSPGEEGYSFVLINLVSWLSMMVFLAFLESKRTADHAEQHSIKDSSEGTRT